MCFFANYLFCYLNLQLSVQEKKKKRYIDNALLQMVSIMSRRAIERIEKMKAKARVTEYGLIESLTFPGGCQDNFCGLNKIKLARDNCGWLFQGFLLRRPQQPLWTTTLPGVLMLVLIRFSLLIASCFPPKRIKSFNDIWCICVTQEASLCFASRDKS